MAFLAPWMLWGLVGASIPILLHLFYRSRYRTVPWAAMKFLLTSVEQTSRRLKFQEILLLIVRTALLAFLALALARPSSMSRGSGADGDAVDAVFLIDTSFSMGARDGAGTRLDRARAAALAVIDHLPPHSTVQVVTVADRATLLGPTAASNLEQARAVVKAVELSHLSTDLLPGVLEAGAALARGHCPNRELYLFSDMQRSGWDRQAQGIVTKLKEASAKASIHLVRCGTRMPRSAAVIGITSPSEIPHTGERAGFAVLVRNSGTEAVRDLTVTLEVEGRAQEKESRAIPSIGPGETQAVTLSGRLDKAGRRAVTATLSADDLEADNRFTRVLHVRDQVRTLVVDGNPSDVRPENSSSFYLMHSLRPVPESAWGVYHVQPRMVSPGEASPALLADMDLCILSNVPLTMPGESTPGTVAPDFLERLARFVREGRGVLIFAGSRVGAELYNRALFEEHGLLPFRLSAAETAPAARPIRLDPEAGVAPFLEGFKEEPLNRIAQTTVTQWLGADEKGAPAESKVALRYTNGKVAVASRKIGAGEVILVTTSADPKWTDWPLRHTYLPFIHVALGRLLEGTTQELNRVAGEPLRWRPPALEGSRVYVAIDPDGRRTRLGVPEMIDGQPVVSVTETARAGIYKIVPEGESAKDMPEGVILAAVPDLRESEDLETLSEKQLDERLGFKVIHVTAGDDAGVFAGTERLKREWSLWILVAVLLLVAFETVLAWYCGRGW